MSQDEETEHGPEQIAPEWVAITPQRAEVRWTGPTRQASETHLALLASDVFAVQAGQPPRFFGKGEDGVWRRKTEPAKEIRVVGAVMVRDGCVFAARRAPHKSLAGQWEFPGGKIEAGETPKQALAREMREEFGVEVSVGDWLTHGEAMVDGTRIILDVYATTHISGKFVLTDHDAVYWFPADRLDLVLWAEVGRALLPKLQERLGPNPWPANIIPTAPYKAEF